jgi:uncharacterized protein (TIGR03083 family)
MSEISDRYRRIASGFSERLRNLKGDQWSNLTPCTEWTVRDLVNHVISTHRRALSARDGTTPGDSDPAHDLGRQFSEASGEISEELADPERAARQTEGTTFANPKLRIVGVRSPVRRHSGAHLGSGSCHRTD